MSAFFHSPRFHHCVVGVVVIAEAKRHANFNHEKNRVPFLFFSFSILASCFFKRGRRGLFLLDSIIISLRLPFNRLYVCHKKILVATNGTNALNGLIKK